MTRRAVLKAYAKLNLGLRVLYRRPDGYHELRTIFRTISLADRLAVEFTPNKQTRITIHGTPEIADNLVERSARMVLEAMRIQGDIVFHLKKHIPSGAGLGGGSSDAAAVLLALPVLTGVTLPLDVLASLAASLGSDVPFFLYGGSALGIGRGEELYPVPDQPTRHALLVTPAVHSSTADAYRDLSQTLTSIALQNKLSSFQQSIWLHGRDANRPAFDENDFEPVVFARHPELARIKERLTDSGAIQAAMTGSGSAVFGLFPNKAAAVAAATSFPGEKVFPISFLTGAQYRASWRRALKRHLKPNVPPDTWPPPSLYAQ